MNTKRTCATPCLLLCVSCTRPFASGIDDVASTSFSFKTMSKSCFKSGGGVCSKHTHCEDAPRSPSKPHCPFYCYTDSAQTLEIPHTNRGRCRVGAKVRQVIARVVAASTPQTGVSSLFSVVLLDLNLISNTASASPPCIDIGRDRRAIGAPALLGKTQNFNIIIIE